MTTFDHTSIPLICDPIALHFPLGLVRHAYARACKSATQAKALLIQSPTPTQTVSKNFAKKVFMWAQHLPPSGVLTSRGQDVAFILQTRGSY